MGSSGAPEARSPASPPPRSAAALGAELLRPWNLMTLVRVPLAALVLLVHRDWRAVLVVMALAGLSDLLDGWMARRARASGELGAWLDPLCDKVFVVCLLFAILLALRPPWWMVALAATRELLIVPALAVHALWPGRSRRSLEYKALPVGKATTVAQFAVGVALLLGRPDLAGPLAVLAGALGVASAVVYGRRAIRNLLGGGAAT